MLCIGVSSNVYHILKYHGLYLFWEENKNSKKFNFSKVETTNQANLVVPTYILSISHLSFRFFQLMGSVFSFVSSDLKQKIDILNQLLNKEEEKYQTVKTMIEHEKENKLLEKGDYSNGARTLLRLHRGLGLFFKFRSEWIIDKSTNVIKKRSPSVLNPYWWSYIYEFQILLENFYGNWETSPMLIRHQAVVRMLTIKL